MCEWLWKTDPEEHFSPNVLLNKNQLYGLLICRQKAYSTQTVEIPDERIFLTRKQPMDMSYREWKDTISNFLIEWPSFILNIRKKNPLILKFTKDFIEQCLSRFGYLVGNAHEESVLDDFTDTEPRQEDGLLVLSMGPIRRGLGALLILYRHLYLLAVSEDVDPQKRDIGINKFHQEASMQDFNLMYMHFQLPVAAKLIYRHDFPGMYNHVSQPVYFHNPEFSKIKRQMWHEENVEPIHIISNIRELYPEVKVVFEEDNFDPSVSAGWYWLLVAGRIYMVTPEPKVLFCSDLSTLIGFYIDHK